MAAGEAFPHHKRDGEASDWMYKARHALTERIKSGSVTKKQLSALGLSDLITLAMNAGIELPTFERAVIRERMNWLFILALNQSADRKNKDRLVDALYANRAQLSAEHVPTGF